MGDIPRKTIAICMTVPSALRVFMVDHVRALAEIYDVTVFSNFALDSCDELFDSSVKLVHIPFAREIRPFTDLECLCRLIAHFLSHNFCCVHSIMPKTGLLGMTAARISRVPVRIHMFTGQVWVTRSGVFRTILKLADRLIASCSTQIYTDSSSQCEFLVSENVIKAGIVLGNGSVNGVNSDRFQPSHEGRKIVRRHLGIPENAIVFGFIGRLNIDKGILDLVQAFSEIRVSADSHLVLVGTDEMGIEGIVRKRFPDILARVHFTGHSSAPEKYYVAFDVFCIPSYREGFGSAVIEAAACGVPALASRIYGLTDAVIEGETGLMHRPRDVAEIRAGLERYANDAGLRERFGIDARRRAKSAFPTQHLVTALLAEYQRLLNEVETVNH